MPSLAPPLPPPKDADSISQSPTKKNRVSTAATGTSAIPGRASSAAEKPLPQKPVRHAETAPELTNLSHGKGTLSRKTNLAPVQVCVRVRPVTTTEAMRPGKDICVEAVKNLSQIRIKSPKEKPREFTFDAVFDLNNSQSNVFESMIHPLISKCLQGYNGCIFAYGQTASGKTYTIQGPSSQPNSEQYGILQRVALQIMKHAEDQIKNNISITIKISYYEIYNEKLIDLLASRDDQSELKIRQETDGSGLFIQGITEITVASLKDIMNLHSRGSKNRTVAETNMNEASSRSHAIMSITVLEQRVDNSTEQTIKKSSKIHIVDLAGSERAESTGATGQKLKEGAAINQSLSCLGNVINALTRPAKDRGHIPYRDSKLTYILSDSLGGNSLTLMIACLSPTLFNYEESLSTLRFAERVKCIKNQAKMNIDPLMLRILELEEEVGELKRRLKLCVCGVGLDGDIDDISSCSLLSRNTTRFLHRLRSSFGRKRVKPNEKTIEDVVHDTSESKIINTRET